MFIQPFLLYGIAIVAACLVVMLVAVAVLYFRINRAFSMMSMEFTLYKKENEKNAKAALDNALHKADEIIKDTQLFTDEMKKGVHEAVSKSVNQGQSTYAQILSDVGNKSANELVTFSHSLQETMKNQSEQLTAQLQKEVAGEQNSFEEAVSKGEELILKELSEKAQKMLPVIIKDALGHALTEEESERLIINSLEKIKKQHGFS